MIIWSNLIFTTECSWDVEASSITLSNPWSRKFMVAAILQGAGIVGLTILLIIGQATFMKPEVSRVIAAGGVGTWFTFGYLIYLIVGVVGVAVSAVFYGLGTKFSTILAYLHLILMNVGIAFAAGLLMYVGYVGGAASLPPDVGGSGLDSGQVHEIIAPFVVPIAISILVVTLGTVLGGLGYLLAYRREIKPSSL